MIAILILFGPWWPLFLIGLSPAGVPAEGTRA